MISRPNSNLNSSMRSSPRYARHAPNEATTTRQTRSAPVAGSSTARAHTRPLMKRAQLPGWHHLLLSAEHADLELSSSASVSLQIAWYRDVWHRNPMHVRLKRDWRMKLRHFGSHLAKTKPTFSVSVWGPTRRRAHSCTRLDTRKPV